MIHSKDYTLVMSKKLSEGELGNYLIRKKILKKGALVRIYTSAGYFYTDRLGFDMPTVVLSRNGGIVMSDTPMEQEGLRIPVIKARGKVLVIGLGIGLFPTMLRMRNRKVKSVLIVEESRDVAKLVYRHIKNSKTELRISDGKDFLATCEEKFDFIFIDIWSAITTTITEVDEWTRLAKPCLAEGGEIRCWLQELYNRIHTKLPKEPINKSNFIEIHEPCLVCGKKIRFDYAGLCMDCADDLEVSEVYARR